MSNNIPELYKGVHASVACPGPSLTPEVVEQMRAVKDRYLIVGVGDSYKLIDFMDELYACDARWWKVHGEKVKRLRPDVNLWTHDEEGINFGACKVQGHHKPGFSTTPNAIHFGSNSGFQALNLCYLWGVSKMILVGYNMQRVGSKTHFFTGRDPSLKIESPYGSFVKQYDLIQKNIKDIIVNCTPDSALTCFRKNTLENELND